MLRIATWNVNSIRARLDHLCQWLDKVQPDIVGVQETKVVDEDFPDSDFAEQGYYSVFSGQKSYNGVALLSRYKAENIVTAFPDLDDPQKRVIAATYGAVRVINLYVPNGASLDSDKYAYKLTWLEHLQRFIAAELEQHSQLVVLGDFNIAPEDRDVHDPVAWEGKILVSPPERQALTELCDLGLKDSFRQFHTEEGQFSWWDYRQGGFRRNRGLRIDFVLSSAALLELCTGCTIDKEPRTWEKPSDHAPVIAEFNV